MGAAVGIVFRGASTWRRLLGRQLGGGLLPPLPASAPRPPPLSAARNTACISSMGMARLLVMLDLRDLREVPPTADDRRLACGAWLRLWCCGAAVCADWRRFFGDSWRIPGRWLTWEFLRRCVVLAIDRRRLVGDTDLDLG